MREDSVVMLCGLLYSAYCSSFFCNDTATTEIYTYLHTLSLHDALPISSLPYVPECDCRPHNLALSVPSLQDVQRTMRLVRFHAAQWHVDPHKIGVLGFSAGGFLVAEIRTTFDRQLYAQKDRKSVGTGKSVSVRVDLGWRGIIKKKKKK